TDLYGGGWKNAKPEDVAYYLDPNNFLRFNPIVSFNQSKVTIPIGKEIEVTANELNVREKPTRNSNKVTKIKKGSRYTVLAESNGWYKINVNGKIGWINGEYVKEINPTSQIGKDVEVTANELNVREKPTRNSNRVTKIKK